MKWPTAVLAALIFGTASAEQCFVDHCHDGDTCTLRCGVGSDVVRRVKVRLHCIDAPEIGQDPWGRVSAKALRHFALAGARIELEPLKQDKYGRLVGVLRLNGTSLNLEMVRLGFAAVYEKYCTEPAYYQAQDEARAARRGIWSQPGVQQRPWEWRHGKTGFIPLPKPTLLYLTRNSFGFFDFSGGFRYFAGGGYRRIYTIKL